MEILDVVDELDQVVGQATPAQVYQQHLLHRIVHVLIFNKQGKMALQLRSRTKTFCPLHWCTAAGGHVQTKESYQEAAQRELNEELGQKLDLTFIGKEYYQSPGVPGKFLGVYIANFDGPFVVNEEVEKVEFFSIKEIKEMIGKGEKFHPELLFILEKHYQN